MAKLGSPKRVFMLSMGLILYVILISLLMFYIEECSIETQQKSVEAQEDAGLQKIRAKCHLIYRSFLDKESSKGSNKVEVNISTAECISIIKDITKADLRLKKTNCRFNSRNFFPWVHCVTFSLMTIGGARLPATVGGQLLLTISTAFGIFPLVKLFIHIGVIFSAAMERAILAFELQVLNRSPRMIHNIFKKLVIFNVLLLLFYNIVFAWITSQGFFGTKLTFVEAIAFWFQGMLTNGQRIEAEVNDTLYSEGGWRVLCIDFGMVGNMLLASSLVCVIVFRMHKKICKASKTIKHSFKRQNPEVYLQIKPLKTHL